VNSFWFLSSLPGASGKSLLRELGLANMLSPMVAYTSRIIMLGIPIRVIVSKGSAKITGDTRLPAILHPASARKAGIPATTTPVSPSPTEVSCAKTMVEVTACSAVPVKVLRRPTD